VSRASPSLPQRANDFSRNTNRFARGREDTEGLHCVVVVVIVVFVDSLLVVVLGFGQAVKGTNHTRARQTKGAHNQSAQVSDCNKLFSRVCFDVLLISKVHGMFRVDPTGIESSFR
jgi:hypothetical protein